MCRVYHYRLRIGMNTKGGKRGDTMGYTAYLSDERSHWSQLSADRAQMGEGEKGLWPTKGRGELSNGCHFTRFLII